eukprot:6190402-Pleurochrysis_carterae.AAC.1
MRRSARTPHDAALVSAFGRGLLKAVDSSWRREQNAHLILNEARTVAHAVLMLERLQHANLRNRARAGHPKHTCAPSTTPKPSSHSLNPHSNTAQTGARTGARTGA